MPRHVHAKPLTSADRCDFSANSNRPDGSPSARELISAAAAARTLLASQPVEAPATAEYRQANRPRHRPQKRWDTESDERVQLPKLFR